MANPTIHKVLDPILKHHRQHRFKRRLSILFTSWGLLGLIAAWLAPLWNFSGDWLWKGFLLVCSFLTFAVWLHHRRQIISVKDLARRIEEEHPSLQSTLITALDQEPNPETGKYHYLQEQVIRKALSSNLKEPWDHPFHLRLFFSGMMRFCSLLVVFWAAYLLASLDKSSSAENSTEAFVGELLVEPGHLEIEKGDALVITARFGQKVPDSVSLVIMPSDGPTKQIPMNRSMEDPLFGASLMSVSADTAYYVTFDGSQSETYKLSVFEFPKLEQADAHLQYPSYTGLEDRTIKDTLRISAVEGSALTYDFFINKSIQSALLMDEQGELFPLSPDPERSHVFQLNTTLQASHRYALQLTDTDGRGNKNPPRVDIRVSTNAPPRLKWIRPKGDQRFSALEEVSFQGEVWDDYGLQAYGVGYQISGLDAVEVETGQGAGAKEKQSIEHLLELETLSLTPGGLLSYYLWAEDIGPDGSLRRHYSDMFFGEIRPFEEIFRQGQPGDSQQQEQQEQQQQQQDPAMQLAELQKDIISATWNIRRSASGSALSDAQSDDLAVVLDSQEEAMGQADALLEQAATSQAGELMQQAREAMSQAADALYDGVHDRSLPSLAQALVHEQQAYQLLLKSRPNESNVTQGQGGGGGGGSGRSQQQLNQLDLTEEDNRYETQSQATGSQDAQQNDSLQNLNRLKDLARRQEDLNERLQELQTALTEAENQVEREALERELKRLRDEQRRMLEDMDELNQRLAQDQEPQNAQSMDQLDQIREQAQQAAEAIENEEISSALAAGARAQEGLESMREDFRQRNSSQFSQAMQTLRQQARDIGERQDALRDQLEEAQSNQQRPSLGANSASREAMELSEAQREELKSIMDQIRQISDDAEDAEPLLSRQLSEAYRQTDSDQIDSLLETTQQLSFLNMAERAAEIEERIHPEIESLETRIEQAAESILGDGIEGLRRARDLLNELSEELDQELAQASGPAPSASDGTGTPENGSSPNDAASPGESQTQGAGPGNARAGSDEEEGSPSQGEESPSMAGNNREDGQSEGQGEGQGQGNTREEPQQLRGGGGGSSLAQTWRNQGTGGEGGSNADQGPMGGNSFREWTDGLREAEEMVDVPELQNDIAAIRDRARAIRREARDGGEEPKWDLVQLQIEKPLYEVRKRVQEELSKRTSKEAIVPVDRDPVPDAYSDLVRTYYETLGEGR